MFLEEYKEIYIANKKKIEEWEKTNKEDDVRLDILQKQRDTIFKEREELNEKIKNKQIIVDALRGTIQNLTTDNNNSTQKNNNPVGKNEVSSNQQTLDSAVFALHGSGRSGRVYNATLKKKGKFYYVMEGSLISSVVTKSKSSNVPKLRHAHKTMITNGNKVKAPIPFPTPSAAASFVIGYTTRGDDLWIEPSSGLTIREYGKKLEGGN